MAWLARNDKMLILVPSPLSQLTPSLPLLGQDLQYAQRCSTWLVENAKPARAALALYNMPAPIRDLTLHEIARTDLTERRKLLEMASFDAPLGLMSDAGCPGIADPGAEIVALAHEMGIRVKPLVGPSSIVLALMASGMNGQNFHFRGYPPVDNSARDEWIKQTETESATGHTTQLAIETPFRNDRLTAALLANLRETTLLCIASDLTGEREYVRTLPVGQWKKNPPLIGKQACLFAWLAQESRPTGKKR